MIFLQETFNLEKKVKKTQKQKYTKSKIKILELIKKKSFGFIQDLHQKDFELLLTREEMESLAK